MKAEGGVLSKSTFSMYVLVMKKAMVSPIIRPRKKFLGMGPVHTATI